MQRRAKFPLRHRHLFTRRQHFAGLHSYRLRHPSGQAQDQAQQCDNRNMNHDASHHADAVSPLGIGQPSYPSRRHPHAAA